MTMRNPTWLQRLSVASYCFFIPFFLLLNLLCLTNRWTALMWLGWTVWINFGPGRFASKTGTWPKLLRPWKWWNHCADYFPTQLIKTAELDPEQRYIFVVAPHGVVTMYAWPCFDTDGAGFRSKFPGIDVHPCTLEINFRVPMLREFLLLHGVVDASQHACLMVLGKGSGQSILLAVGGAQESLLARPGTMDLVLAKRKGFVRIALQTGAKLVPVIGFGENELYDARETRPGSFMDWAQRFLKQTFGFTLPNNIGVGLFGGSGLLPFPKPLNVVVGPAVDFDASKVLNKDGEASLDDMIEAYHKQFTAAQRQLWDAHKDKFAKERRRSLTIVE